MVRTAAVPHADTRRRARTCSPAKDAILALMRTTDAIRCRFAAVVEPFGVTGQQYNVLRILRGARPDPLPTLTIAERMLEQTPGITRLLDRLEEKGLVARERHPDDRRQVLCTITAAGLALLAKMDGPVEAANDAVVGTLSRTELNELTRLLKAIHG